MVRFLDENVDKYESESGRADQAWTAVISPYLHWGELSPRLVLHEAFVGKIAAKFRRKLAWRDLSYWLLSLFPSMDQVLTNHNSVFSVLTRNCPITAQISLSQKLTNHCSIFKIFTLN